MDGNLALWIKHFEKYGIDHEPFMQLLESFGHLWPAFQGQKQYPYEPPRVVSGMKDRAKRVEALGNAVVPWQVRPILEAIYATLI